MQSLFRAPAAPLPPEAEPRSGAHRARLILVRLLSLYLAFVFVMRGWDKFDAAGSWATAFNAWGLSAWLRMLLGGLEIAGGISLLVPRVTVYAALLLGAVLIGTSWLLMQDQRWTDVAVIGAYAVGLGVIVLENRRASHSLQ